jgi:hypothetical protein
VKAVPGKIGAAQSSCARAASMLFAVEPLFPVRVAASVRGLMSEQIESGNGVERRALMTMRCCDLRPRRR